MAKTTDNTAQATDLQREALELADRHAMCWSELHVNPAREHDRFVPTDLRVEDLD
ncbi:MAG: hypothetical protein IT379_30340 [Deltaproteobacteria bacterium]|nr:hypothetical protein [Deltaproteobacteria bacterium]